MYRHFHTEGDLHELIINWTRVPASLSLSAGRYKTSTNFSVDDIRVSITLWGLMILPDFGRYTVTVCSNCTCANTTYVLRLSECDPDTTPEPVGAHYTKIIAETALTDPLMVYVIFTGSTDSLLYTLYWSRDNHDVCPTSTNSVLSRCNRTVFGNCTFTANLYIHQPSYKDSANYTVQAVGYDHSSNKSTYDIGEVVHDYNTTLRHQVYNRSPVI